MSGPSQAPARPRAFGSAARWALLFLTIYLPLEEFFLKWVSSGPASYLLLRLAGEALLYGALACVVLAHLMRGLRLPATPIDRPFGLFLVIALLSLLWNDAPLLGSIVNLRVLVRFVAVLYLVLYLELRDQEVHGLLRWILLGALVQGAIGILQHLQGGAGEFWLPREASVELGGVHKEFAVLAGGIELGAVLGTTDHSVAYALFLLVAGTLAAALGLSGRAARPLSLLVGLLALVGILFSYSRACLFGYLLALLGALFLLRAKPAAKRVLALGAIFAPLLMLGVLFLGRAGAPAFVEEKEVRVSPLESVELLFTRRFLETSQASRLWILRDVGGELVSSAGWLGFGPDPERARAGILRSGGASLHRLLAYRAFEDVYWVALLAYYGFLGVVLFVLVLARLTRAAWRLRRRAENEADTAVAVAFTVLALVVIPLSFLAPTFDFRTFAFYFWLLAGLVLRAGSQAVAERLPVAPGRLLVGA